MKVFWTNTALSHLETIFDYFNIKANTDIARKEVIRIIKKIQLLENSPNLGKTEELLVDRKYDYRFIISGNYKVIYFI